MLVKYEKIISEDTIKRDAVLEILKILNGKNISDCKEILSCAKFFAENNCLFMAESAQLHIDSIRS